MPLALFLFSSLTLEDGLNGIAHSGAFDIGSGIRAQGQFACQGRESLRFRSAHPLIDPYFLYDFAVPLLSGLLLTLEQQFLDRFSDPFYYVEPGLVPVRPRGDRFGISGKSLKLAEGSPPPVAG